MAKKEPSQLTEIEHNYLDVGADGLPTWALVTIVLFVGLAIVGIFYGLNSLNRASPSTPSPDSLALDQATGAATSGPGERTSTPGPLPSGPSPTPPLSATLTPAFEPPTYTVGQGDSLIAIAQQLNVNANDLQTLNQISGETIYPGQVLLVPPTVTPWPETGPFPHVVGPGETLLAIAQLYDVTVEEIKSLNSLASDTIFSGQQILIPARGVRRLTPTPVLVTPEPWQPATITGGLDITYSLKIVKGRFTLHIPPGTRAAAESETAKITQLLEQALDYSQALLHRRLTGRFEVYVAETFFDTPHTAQRCFSMPEQRRLFLLYDGSGTPAERLYFATYALTQLVAAQTLGEAASPLLGEGLAVYAGRQALMDETTQTGRYLSPAQFCAAYQATGRLPRVSRALEFEGHLGHLDQYFAAGCFVGYLIEKENWDTFVQVYLSGDYEAVYEQRLSQLESDWVATLREAAAELPFDPDELVRLAAEVDDGYHRLWADLPSAQSAAYRRLDRARLAVLQGRLSTAQEHLDAFEELLQ